MTAAAPAPSPEVYLGHGLCTLGNPCVEVGEPGRFKSPADTGTCLGPFERWNNRVRAEVGPDRKWRKFEDTLPSRIRAIAYRVDNVLDLIDFRIEFSDGSDREAVVIDLSPRLVKDTVGMHQGWVRPLPEELYTIVEQVADEHLPSILIDDIAEALASKMWRNAYYYPGTFFDRCLNQMTVSERCFYPDYTLKGVNLTEVRAGVRETGCRPQEFTLISDVLTEGRPNSQVSSLRTFLEVQRFTRYDEVIK